MDKFPSLEALEGAHRFPCVYVFKLFGPHEQSFVDSIHRQLSPHVVDDNAYELLLKASSKGNYCVVDVRVQALSADHVQQIYSSFHEVEGLKTLL